MKYEITIRELTPFTEQELKERRLGNRDFGGLNDVGYSDTPHHEVKILRVELNDKEFRAIKKAVIDIF